MYYYKAINCFKKSESIMIFTEKKANIGDTILNIKIEEESTKEVYDAYVSNIAVPSST